MDADDSGANDSEGMFRGPKRAGKRLSKFADPRNPPKIANPTRFFRLRILMVAYSTMNVLLSALIFMHIIKDERFKLVVQMMLGMQLIFLMFEGVSVVLRLLSQAAKNERERYQNDKSPSPALSSETGTALFHLITLNSSLNLLDASDEIFFPWTTNRQEMKARVRAAIEKNEKNKHEGLVKKSTEDGSSKSTTASPKATKEDESTTKQSS